LGVTVNVRTSSILIVIESDGEAVTEPSSPEPSVWAQRWRRAKPFVLIAVGIIALDITIRIAKSVDWTAVWDSIQLLSFPSTIALLVFLALRQTFNAIPLTKFVKGLSLRRSVQNDLTAFLMGTIAPPPADVVLRVGMFKSWDIDPVEGMAGVTLNSLTFYAVRFLAPAIGVGFLIFDDLVTGQLLSAFLSSLVSIAILVALYFISRGDRLAHLIGLTAGSVAVRVKKTIDPQEWAKAVVDFRAKIGDRVQTGILPSMGALVLMVLSDGAILFVSVRAVGIPSSVLSLALIFGTFLVAYPLTLFPLAGLGILDAALITTWTEAVGTGYEAQFVAALIIWRIITLLVTLGCGLIALFMWRRLDRRRAEEQDSTVEVAD
jgi:uncharacterized membrane protein YbhN (UPF0104 family)